MVTGGKLVLWSGHGRMDWGWRDTQGRGQPMWGSWGAHQGILEYPAPSLQSGRHCPSGTALGSGQGPRLCFCK